MEPLFEPEMAARRALGEAGEWREREPKQELVFIGIDLDNKALETALNSCLE